VRPSDDPDAGGSLLRPELRPWPRGSWDELGERTKRIGVLGRKIGVVPMWFRNGQRIATTMIQVSLPKTGICGG
jgi:hypothetical protein